MFSLTKIFGNRRPTTADKDTIAAYLRTTPEALDDFEKSYAQAIETPDEQNPFATSAKQVRNSMQQTDSHNLDQNIDALCDTIASEFIALTSGHALPERITEPSDLDTIPLDIRPQLTVNAYKKDLGGQDTYVTLVDLLIKYEQTGDMNYYHRFRQGLDILDLDPITYEMLSCNQNAISHWFPSLKTACDMQHELKYPQTTIVKVPLPILQLSRLDYTSLTQATFNIINKWAYNVFNLDDTKHYFVKTGTYSSKFDFRNAHVVPDEVPELGSYLLYIQHVASEMAGPLTQPSIYGMSTTNEWCVREWIEDTENNPTIYHGMPLRCEMRFFIDCDTDEIIGVSPYWREDIMKQRLAHASDADTPDMLHDYVIYEAHRPWLEARYDEVLPKAINAITAILPNLNLKGQWSLDIMCRDNELWAIDMATLPNSALSDVVPSNKIKHTKENWIPQLSTSTSL